MTTITDIEAEKLADERIKFFSDINARATKEGIPFVFEKELQLALKVKELLERQRWIPWTGEYEKQFYDVWVHQCEVVMHCWPNAGEMMAMDGSSRRWKPNECLAVRVSEFQTFPQPPETQR